MPLLTIDTDHLADADLRLAHYLAALAHYRHVAAEFTAALHDNGLADRAALDAADEELARWREATESDRMRPIREVTEQFGVGASSIRMWIADGQVKAEQRYGKLWYVLPDDLERLIAEGEIVPRNRPSRCELCGQIKPDTQRRLDPFLEDVHNERVWRNICDACFQERLDEI